MKEWIKDGERLVRQADSLRERVVLRSAIEAAEETLLDESLPMPNLRRAALDVLSRVRVPSVSEVQHLQDDEFEFFEIEPISLGEMFNKDGDRFSYLTDKSGVRAYVPPVMVVGLDLKRMILEGSNGLDFAAQLEMVESESQRLQVEHPDARAIVLPASAYVQLQGQFWERTGSHIFSNEFTRALDMVSFDAVAAVGRYGKRTYVDGWNVDIGLPDKGILPGVVFVQ